VIGALDKQRVQETYDILQEVQYAFTNTDGTGFLNTVRTGNNVTQTSVVPGLLSELVYPITSNSLAMPNSCGGTFQTSTAASTWATFGPFLKRTVSTTQGLATPIGRINNTLTRTLAIQGTHTQPVSIQLFMDSIDVNDAAALDLLVDGAAGTNAGTLQYSISGGLATVFYLIPIVNRC
jgi:hypothetical protein